MRWTAELLHTSICYHPGFDICKGLEPDLWFRLVSFAPDAVETNVLVVEGGQSAPQGPESRSRIHCCCCSSVPVAIFRKHFRLCEIEKGMLTSCLPSKNSQHTAAGRGHSRCCCPEGELGSVSFASVQDQTPLLNRDGPPILTPSSWGTNTRYLACIHTYIHKHTHVAWDGLKVSYLLP